MQTCSRHSLWKIYWDASVLTSSGSQQTIQFSQSHACLESLFTCSLPFYTTSRRMEGAEEHSAVANHVPSSLTEHSAIPAGRSMQDHPIPQLCHCFPAETSRKPPMSNTCKLE
eukprot:2499116-Amphidinium_carterae.1